MKNIYFGNLDFQTTETDLRVDTLVRYETANERQLYGPSISSSDCNVNELATMCRRR